MRLGTHSSNDFTFHKHCKVFCAKSGHSVGKFESRYLILCALHLARPLSECVIGMGKIGSYHYLCFANSYKIVKLCEGSAQSDRPDLFVCSLVIIRGRAPKAQGRGSNFFFSRGGLIFQNRGGARGGSLQKFSLEFHRVIQINKNIEK